MTENKYPKRKELTKYPTPKIFNRNLQKQNPAFNQKRRLPITQHRG